MFSLLLAEHTNYAKALQLDVSTQNALFETGFGLLLKYTAFLIIVLTSFKRMSI